MGRTPKHRYSQEEEDLVWEHYTAEEKEEHRKYDMGYEQFTANKDFIDALRSKVMTRKEQDGRV